MKCTKCKRPGIAKDLCGRHYKQMQVEKHKAIIIKTLEETPRQYNIGIIGTGIQGRRFINTLQEAAFKNINISVSNTTGSFADYKCYNDWKDLLASNIDGVIVAADPDINVSVIKHANFLQIPVLVEKPVSLYLSEINSITNCKIPIIVDYIHLHSNQYNELKDNVAGKTITRIISIGYNNGPFKYYSGLFDYMPHDLSMCIDLAPGKYTIKEKSATKGKFGGNLYKTQLLGDNGTELLIMCGNGGAERVRKLAVFCSDETEYIYDHEVDKKAPMRNLLKHFLSVINKEEIAYPNIDMTRDIHNILYNLSKTGKE